MYRFSSRHLILFLFLLLALPALACSALGSDATVTPVATSTAEATATTAPTNTPEATATLEPTATPEATETPEPTPTAEIDANFIDYESGVNGVSFSYPGDWSILDLFFLAVASDDTLLEDTSGVDDGAVIVIFAGDSDETPAGDPESLLEEAAPGSEFQDVTIIDGPTETEIQGQPATLVTFEAIADDGTAITIRLANIVSGPRTAGVIGITPTAVADNYLPTIEAVINSIELFEPTEEDPFGGLVGGDEPPAEELIPFGPGEIATGSVAEGGFQDYQFTGIAGAPIVVALQPAEDFDVILEIFPVGDENSLLADVDTGFPSEPEVLVFTPEADGDYFARVSGFAGTAGDYLITMFDPSQGVTLEGAVADDEAAEFRVCVPAGELLIAVVFPDEDFDPVFNLNGPGGGQLLDEIDNGASGDPEVIFYTGGVDSTEDYAVIINLSGFAGFGGSYTLFIGPAGVVQDGC